jgi:hypothetical protein
MAPRIFDNPTWDFIKYGGGVEHLAMNHDRCVCVSSYIEIFLEAEKVLSLQELQAFLRTLPTHNSEMGGT